jgi:hypothetical protein
VIISHTRRFIFIKTVKTAGTSLEMALSKHCAEGDVLARLEPREEKQRKAVAGIGAQGHLKPVSAMGGTELVRYLTRGTRHQAIAEHSSALQVREFVGEEIWASYFKFAVVRHPFDRMVSRFYYSRHFEEENGRRVVWDHEDFDQFLRYRTEHLTENWRLLTELDRVLVDFAVHYENLEADLAEVSRRIGLDHNIHDDMRAIKAKGGIRPEGASVKQILTGHQRDLIARVCAKEMETFGYDFEAVAAE